eukprot:TRINITY_DN1524_c0_g1_i2.p3 TRINITY_DN1524_c0_g1~~TRINITY_DN1524_c0_g1_i2.p3  ORF type:complete len:664 (+),score=137.59 TRINITY_DN1524_c0_g1_i2:2741-4732(+)
MSIPTTTKSPVRPDPQTFGVPFDMRFEEFSKSGIQEDLRGTYEKPRKLKTQGLDSKAYVEEMSRMLKVQSNRLTAKQDADVKLLSSAKQIELYRKANDSLQQQNNELRLEKQQVVRQLQSLFSLYNKQKRTIDQIQNNKNDFESEKQNYKDRIVSLERENERLKLDRSRELEIVTARHKNIVDEMERRLTNLEKKLSVADDEAHRLRLAETDLKEQLRVKDKKLIETEYELDSAKSKLEHEVALLTRQKEQLSQENRRLEKKLLMAERDEERRADEERRIRKELARFTYANEELAEELQRWKEKFNTATLHESGHKRGKRSDDSAETPKMQRLAEIERKLETILSYHKTGSKLSKLAKEEPEQQSINGTDQEEIQKQSIDQAEEVQEEENEDEEGGSPEDMLKNLTVQILEKDELRNVNIIKMFKLDRIQLEDKVNEYKNLLKAMGALYFANRYAKMVPPLLNHWRGQLHAKLQEEVEEMEENEAEEMEANEVEDEELVEGENDDEEGVSQQHIRGDTESDPGPLNNILDEGQEIKEVEGSGSASGSASGHHYRPGIEIDPDLANREAMGEDLTDEYREREGIETDPEMYKGAEILVDDKPEGEEWNDQEEGEDSDEIARNDRMELVENLGGRKMKGRAKSDQDADEYFNEQIVYDEADQYQF